MRLLYVIATPFHCKGSSRSLWFHLGQTLHSAKAPAANSFTSRDKLNKKDGFVKNDETLYPWMRSTVATQKAVLKTPGIGSASEFSTSTFAQKNIKESASKHKMGNKCADLSKDLHPNDDVIPSIRHGRMRECGDWGSNK